MSLYHTVIYFCQTIQMEFTSNNNLSYWLKHSGHEIFRSTSDLPDCTDVVVIGAGIAGASSAYHLSALGIKCTLVDSRSVSGGATGRNGGMISPGTSQGLLDTIHSCGIDNAKRSYDYSVKCTKAIESFVDQHDIDCELRFGGKVNLARTTEELHKIRETYETYLVLECNSNVEWWTVDDCKAHTKSDYFLGGMFTKYCGQLWGSKLVQGIVKEAEKLGSNIQSHTNVERIIENENQYKDDTYPWVVVTNRGNIHTKYIVHATNAYASHLLPCVKDLIFPVRNQVVMTCPLPPLWSFALSINYGYEYLMQRPDGRVLIGGLRYLSPTKEMYNEDETTLNPEISSALHSYLPKYFHVPYPLDIDRAEPPPIHCDWDNNGRDNCGVENNDRDGDIAQDLEYRQDIIIEDEWIGIMGFSRDANPLIGPINSLKNQYIIAGFTGHGMPYAFLAGQNISEMINGLEPSFFIPELFLPCRFGI